MDLQLTGEPEMIGARCDLFLREAIDRLGTESSRSGHPEAAGPGASVELNVQKIEETRQLYAFAEEMPICLFNTKMVVAFLSSILWPLSLWGLQQAFDFIKPHLHL